MNGMNATTRRTKHATNELAGTEAHQAAVRERYGTARLKGYFHSDGSFAGWRIVAGVQDRELTGLHVCHEEAWVEAAGWCE